MKADLTFKEEFAGWLSAIPVTYEIRKDPPLLFDLVEVRQNGQAVLAIRLIDLKTWVDSGDQAKELALGISLKQELLRQNGIPAVTLWEDLWISERDIVKSRLCAMLGQSQRIPGRMTQVRRIDKPVATVFLNQNHLQHAVSAKFKYGLFLPSRYYRILHAENQPDSTTTEILVAVATFSHPRIFERNGRPFRSYELSRFANAKYTTVVGGFDKLLQAFIKDCRPDDLMTYADLEWSDGASYKRLGFEAVSDKPAMTFWLDMETKTRYPLSADAGNENIVRIYNAGSRKFVKEILASYSDI